MDVSDQDRRRQEEEQRRAEERFRKEGAGARSQFRNELTMVRNVGIGCLGLLALLLIVGLLVF